LRLVGNWQRLVEHVKLYGFPSKFSKQLSHLQAWVVRKILKRKLLSAYFASLGVLAFFVTMNGVHAEPVPHLFDNAWGILFIILLYVTPVMFIYGIAASSFIEFLLGRWSIPTRVSIVAALIAHMLFGSILGVVFRTVEAGLLGALCAGTFYIFDRLIFCFWSKKPKLSYTLGAFPIVMIGGVLLYFYIITPPMPPFTAEEAVHFATSGKGTIIDDYPKEAGKLSLVTNGYDIERETAVKEIKKDEYEVSFIEHWTKDGKTGQRTSNYRVSRESSGGISMSANGGGGDKPPFTKSP
jgi:hypothetical protein